MERDLGPEFSIEMAISSAVGFLRKRNPSDGTQHLHQKLPIRARVGGRFLGGGADFDALDHDRAVEADALQPREHSLEINLVGRLPKRGVGRARWRRGFAR